VVVKAVPHNVTVAGVPAKIVGEAGCAEPSRTMDQMINAIGLDFRNPFRIPCTISADSGWRSGRLG